ncbi:hypothetical protein OG948_36865 (plasmid) [Embleya sp. NBC_00888]|uniref:hypothetical protein n=1 Tax=Embleya sp. NBC_00888 TaxID=2975960 RepID=UPI002F90A328|nr:hypothetical protein OG948_36865 [Embleya sp. NBC_00888]
MTATATTPRTTAIADYVDRATHVAAPVRELADPYAATPLDVAPTAHVLAFDPAPPAPTARSP